MWERSQGGKRFLPKGVDKPHRHEVRCSTCSRRNMMSLFMDEEVVDEWTEHSKVGKDSTFRAQYVDGNIEIQFYDGEIWLQYRTDSTI